MERISRDRMCMEWAITAAKRGTCERKQVGAVVVEDARPLIAGYNGPPSGFYHCGPEYCDMSQPCTRSVHAEANCIARAAMKGIKLEGTTLYSTVAPCYQCAQLIVNSGISSVIYLHPYRNTEGVKLLLLAKVFVGTFIEGRVFKVREIIDAPQP